MGEINKFVAGLCSTLLVLLGLNFFGEQIFHPHGDSELAFALEIEDTGGDDDGAEDPLAVLAAALAGADAAAGEKVFKKCKACHGVADGENKTGPHLWGIVGRQVAAVDGFKYSGALPASETWSPANLYAFLESPKTWAKGTSMSFKGLKKPADRANVIAYLNEADGSPEPME